MNKLLEKYKSLPVAVKASTWYIICNVIQNALGLITSPIYTRVLTTEEYGLFTVYQSWMNIIVIFTTLNIQYGVFNTAMIKFEKERERFISAAQGLTTVISIAWIVIYAVAHNVWNKIFDLPTILVVAMAFEMCFLPAKDFWAGKQRFEFKYKKLVLYTLALTMLNPIICIVAVLNSEHRGITRVLVAAFVNVCFYIVIYVYNFIKGKVFFEREYWSYILKFGIPLIAYYLSQMIFNQSDKIMIQHMVGNDKAGIYGLVYTCSIVAIFVINSINNAFVPWTYQKMKEKQYGEIRGVSSLLSFLIMGILLGVIMIGPEMVRILATKEYYEAIWIMPPVIGSLFFLFLSQLFINIEFYYEEKGYLVGGSILSAVINIVLNYIAIPRWGYIAAGYTTFLSYIIFAVCNYYYMRKICKERMGGEEIYDKKSLLALSVIFSLCISGSVLIYANWKIRWGILLTVIGIFLFNFRKLWEKLKILFTKSS